MIFPAVKVHYSATTAGLVEVPSSTRRRLIEVNVINTSTTTSYYVWLLDLAQGATVADQAPLAIVGKVPPETTLSFASAVGWPFDKAIFIGMTTDTTVGAAFDVGHAGEGLITSIITQEPG